MSIIYNLAFIIFGIFYIPYFLIKAKYRYGFGERLGILPKDICRASKNKKTIWLHAVSVGEVQAARPLINKLKERFSGARFIVSTVTHTGNELAKKIISADDSILYLPFDVSFITQKVVNRISPAVFIVLETEIWPNLILSLKKAGIPILLINGRISDNSFKRYILVSSFLKHALNKIDLLLCKTTSTKTGLFLSAPTQKKFSLRAI